MAFKTNFGLTPLVSPLIINAIMHYLIVPQKYDLYIQYTLKQRSNIVRFMSTNEIRAPELRLLPLLSIPAGRQQLYGSFR